MRGAKTRWSRTQQHGRWRGLPITEPNLPPLDHLDALGLRNGLTFPIAGIDVGYARQCRRGVEVGVEQARAASELELVTCPFAHLQPGRPEARGQGAGVKPDQVAALDWDHLDRRGVRSGSWGGAAAAEQKQSGNGQYFTHRRAVAAPAAAGKLVEPCARG